MDILGMGLITIVGGMILTGNGQTLMDFAKSAAGAISSLFNNISGKAKEDEPEPESEPIKTEEEKAEEKLKIGYAQVDEDGDTHEYDTDDKQTRQIEGLKNLANEWGQHDGDISHAIVETEEKDNQNYSHTLANFLTTEVGWRVVKNGAPLDKESSREELKNLLAGIEKRDNGIIANVAHHVINGDFSSLPTRNVDFYVSNALKELLDVTGDIAIDSPERTANNLAIADTVEKVPQPEVSAFTRGAGEIFDHDVDTYEFKLRDQIMADGPPYRIDENGEKQELTDEEVLKMIKDQDINMKGNVRGCFEIHESFNTAENDAYYRTSNIVYNLSDKFEKEGIYMPEREKYLNKDTQEQSADTQNANEKPEQTQTSLAQKTVSQETTARSAGDTNGTDKQKQNDDTSKQEPPKEVNEFGVPVL